MTTRPVHRERPLARPFAVLCLLNVLAKACGCAVTILLVRRFGESGFGSLTLAQSLAAYGLIAATCGVDLLAVRRGAAAADELPRLAATLVRLRCLTGLAVLALLCGLALLVPPFQRVAPLLVLFGLTLLTSAVSVRWVAQAAQNVRVLGLAELGTHALYLAFALIAVGARLPLWSIPASLVLAEAIVAAALFVWMSRHVAPPGRPLPLPLSWKLLRQAAPIGGARILRGVALGSDFVLIGLLLAFSDLGLYAAAHKLFTTGIAPIALYFVILLPRLSQAAGSTGADRFRRLPPHEALRTQLRQSWRRTTPLALGLLAAGLLLAGPMLQWLYGPRFLAARPALQILLVALLILHLNGHPRQALLALGEQRRDLVNVAIGAGAHLAFKLLLIPRLGIAGAAWGTLLGELLLFALGCRSLRIVLRAKEREKAEPAGDSRVNAAA